MHSITCKKHPIFGAFTGSKGIRENYLDYRGRPRKFNLWGVREKNHASSTPLEINIISQINGIKRYIVRLHLFHILEAILPQSNCNWTEKGRFQQRMVGSIGTDQKLTFDERCTFGCID